jgi:hypothetical protein
MLLLLLGLLVIQVPTSKGDEVSVYIGGSFEADSARETSVSSFADLLSPTSSSGSAAWRDVHSPVCSSSWALSVSASDSHIVLFLSDLCCCVWCVWRGIRVVVPHSFFLFSISSGSLLLLFKGYWRRNQWGERDKRCFRESRNRNGLYTDQRD